jgi:hypothetical protein
MIKNCNANAIIAVYPLRPSDHYPHYHSSLGLPSFAVSRRYDHREKGRQSGDGRRNSGSIGVVVNAPTPNEIVRQVTQRIDIPLVVTVVSEKTDIAKRIAAGASILNVSGAGKR